MARRRDGETSRRGASRDEARERLASNPFYVLELRPDCTRAEVERQGQKLIGMLELELSAAASFPTPFGLRRRTPEAVREAMAELRDPNRRLLHELWATLDPGTHMDAAQGSGASPGPDLELDEGPDLRPFPALHALGFGDWSRRA